MRDTRAADPEAIQFRRQLTATLVGAVIAMSSSAGIAVFQWKTQSAERERQFRMEALSQFAREVSNTNAIQAGMWHLANRCEITARQARNLAARSDPTKSDVLEQYKELRIALSTMESEMTANLQEAARQRAATSGAYYRLLAAFKDMQPTSYTQDEPLRPWVALSGSPDKEELVALAGFLEGWSKKLRVDSAAIAQLYVGWSAKIVELAARVQQ